MQTDRPSNEVRLTYSNNCLVSRIQASTKVNKMQIELDVNTDIYPMSQGQFYKFCLATSVNADGSDTFDVIRYENQE